jgi:ferredoxin
MNYTKEIQDIASRLFAEDKIDVFIGYQKSGVKSALIPCLVNKPDDVKSLVFTGQATFNLSNYLKTEHIRNKRVGFVVKGCDSRSLNLILTEKQAKRENLYIVGICCDGIEDEAGNKYSQCDECMVPDAVIYDELIGSKHEKRSYKPNPDVIKLQGKDLTERAAFFENVFANCIRCNACRNSCPLCYCEKCVIDQESSFYHHGANDIPNAAMALTTWSLHLAGRCVDCRNCTRACPKNLPLYLLHKPNEMAIYENFQHHLAGVEPEDRGAFYKYSLDDPEDFIM